MMCDIKISPKYCLCKLINDPLIDDRLDVFEDRVLGWMLNHVRKLIDDGTPHADFVTLLILTGYFEGIAIIENGEDNQNHSFEFFKIGFLSVFSDEKSYLAEDTDRICDILYEDLKCGLYHTWFMGTRIKLESGTFAINKVRDPKSHQIVALKINPYNLWIHIRNHFEKLMEKLRNPEEMRKRSNFERAFALNKPNPEVMQVLLTN